MPGGYQNRFIHFDLTTKEVSTGEPDPERLRKFIGGKGLGLSLLAEMDSSQNPLDPENPLIFLTGPFTGTSMQTSGRSCLVTRSPLTGNFLDSHAGGFFGNQLKKAGYDYVIITGASDKPVYLHVTPDGGSMEDASDYWGKGTFETEKLLKKKHEKAKVASIGPAGENRVRFACVTTDWTRNFGRGGAGAVMGSKMLKAVVIEGNEDIPCHDEEEFRELTVKMAQELPDNDNRNKRFELGTMMWIRMGQEVGRFLPTKNFQKGQFDDYEKITSETMNKELGWEHSGCYNCIIRCSKKAEWEGKMIEGPEYETTAYLGSGCMISDPKTIAEANFICNDLGMDTISAGVTISFAMEAAEKGVLEDDDIPIEWGSAETVIGLLKKIAHRKGIGDLLAEGTRRASKKLGQGTDHYAIQIGGMELSGVNPLGSYSMLLSLATSDFASHTRMWSASDEMVGNLKLDESLVEYIAEGQDGVNVRNSMIVCDFLPYGLSDIAPYLRALTGFDVDEEELQKVGTRIHHLARQYNLRTGRTHKDDVTIPGRFLKEESIAGLMEGKKIPLDMFKDHVSMYYDYRGWDEEGRPTEKTLKEYGL